MHVFDDVHKADKTFHIHRDILKFQQSEEWGRHTMILPLVTQNTNPENNPNQK